MTLPPLTGGRQDRQSPGEHGDRPCARGRGRSARNGQRRHGEDRCTQPGHHSAQSPSPATGSGCRDDEDDGEGEGRQDVPVSLVMRVSGGRERVALVERLTRAPPNRDGESDCCQHRGQRSPTYWCQTCERPGCESREEGRRREDEEGGIDDGGLSADVVRVTDERYGDQERRGSSETCRARAGRCGRPTSSVRPAAPRI